MVAVDSFRAHQFLQGLQVPNFTNWRISWMDSTTVLLFTVPLVLSNATWRHDLSPHRSVHVWFLEIVDCWEGRKDGCAYEIPSQRSSRVICVDSTMKGYVAVNDIGPFLLGSWRQRRQSKNIKLYCLPCRSLDSGGDTVPTNKYFDRQILVIDTCRWFRRVGGYIRLLRRLVDT